MGQRRRGVIGLLIGLAAVSLPACGSGSNESSGSPAPMPTAPRTAAPAGCGSYCEQAGGYGGGEEGELLMRVDSEGTITPSDGTVPIEVTCLNQEPCRGALLVTAAGPPFTEVGRADLSVPAESSATIAVPISREALAVLSRRPNGLRVTISADYGDPMCPPGSLKPCVAPGEAVIASAP